MRVREETYVVTLSSFEQRLMVRGLNDFRSALMEKNRPTEDVDTLLLKVMDAPRGKKMRRGAREER